MIVLDQIFISFRGSNLAHVLLDVWSGWHARFCRRRSTSRGHKLNKERGPILQPINWISTGCVYAVDAANLLRNAGCGIRHPQLDAVVFSVGERESPAVGGEPAVADVRVWRNAYLLFCSICYRLQSNGEHAAGALLASISFWIDAGARDSVNRLGQVGDSWHASSIEQCNHLVIG